MALLTQEQRILAAALGGSQAAWIGRPLPGFRLRSGDGMMLAQGILFIAFFFFWESMALRAPRDTVFGLAAPLFGLAIFAMIFYQTLGQVLWSWYARGRSYYALTDDGSAIIYTDVFGGLTKRVYLPALSDIDLQLSGDGTGTIVFGKAEIPPWWMRNRGWAPPRLPAFEFIPDASKVYDICAKLQSGKA